MDITVELDANELGFPLIRHRGSRPKECHEESSHALPRASEHQGKMSPCQGRLGAYQAEEVIWSDGTCGFFYISGATRYRMGKMLRVVASTLGMSVDEVESVINFLTKGNINWRVTSRRPRPIYGPLCRFFKLRKLGVANCVKGRFRVESPRVENFFTPNPNTTGLRFYDTNMTRYLTR